MTSPPNRYQYTVGWICPMAIELTAAISVLDIPMQPDEKTLHVPGDDAIYNVGKVGRHYVVVVGCSQMGTSQATTIVTNMRRSFPRIIHILVVGIAGGIPSYGRNLREQIVLGDVVVSFPQGGEGGVTHYNMGAYVEGDFEKRGHMLHPSHALLQAVNNLRVRHSSMPGTQIPKYLQELRKKIIPRERIEFQDPGPEQDRVFEDGYFHGDRSKDCESKCDLTKSILRKDRGEKASRELDMPLIHYGTIGSADAFMASNGKRRELYDKYNIICFEMEAAGVMSDHQGLVIRGICDYSDSHTNKIWQRYAAATAAAYAKELILMLNPEAPLEGPLPERSTSWEMIFPHQQRHPQEGSATSTLVKFEDWNTSQMRENQGSGQVFELYTSDKDQDLGRGLCSIRELGNSKEPFLDILFVHGLTGSPETTWTHPRSKFFWPEAIAVEIPRVRVMLFHWTTNKPQALPHGVESLEAQLLSKRRSDPSRPLMIVSHGAGGLLCQLTLLKNANSSCDKTLFLSTSALVFFGSPLYDNTLTMSSAYATSYAQFCKDSESQLQQRLTRPDKTVKMLKFSPTDSREVFLIEPAYNSSFIDGEKLQGNHSNMTHFLEERDAGYQLMLKTVQAVCCEIDE